MKLRNALLAVSTVAASLAVGLIAPATANADICPAGNYCAWDSKNYTGQRANWIGDDRNYWNSGWNDWSVSVYNNGTSGPGVKDNVRIYTGGNLSGTWACIPAGTGGNLTETFANKVNSHTWDYGNNC